VYDLSTPGEYQQFTLGADVADLGIVSARAWDDGLVVLTGGLQFVESRGWAGGRVTNLVPSGLTDAPLSWAVVPPENSTSGHVEVVVSSGSTVVTLDTLERIDQRINRGPFSHVAISPNGRFFALVTISGLLWVVSSDFARNLSEVDITKFADGPTNLPDRVEWCGDNAVVLAFGGRVVMVGPGGDALQYDYPPAVVLAGEVDGLRIISSYTCEILQKVPGGCKGCGANLTQQRQPSLYSNPVQNTPLQSCTTPWITSSTSRPRPTKPSGASAPTSRGLSTHVSRRQAVSGMSLGSAVSSR